MHGMKQTGSRLFLALLTCSLLCTSPTVASARTFYMRATTAGEATQWRRLDLGVEASRPLLLGIELGGYDLLDDQSGSLSARFSMRYANDFGLDPSLSSEPVFAPQVNDLRVNLLYLRWRPTKMTDLVAGRQWSINALGMRDFDGVTAALVPFDDRALRMRFALYGGRDVQLGYGGSMPGFSDVQGVPLGQERSVDRLPLLAGADLSMSLIEKIQLQASYQRRWRDEASGAERDWRLGDERVGAGALVSPTERINLSAQVSYHTLLAGLDHVGVQTSARISERGQTSLSAGVERRQPWFDSASIFNIFGANPHDELWIAMGSDVSKLSTRFELRSWARAFYGNDAGANLFQSGFATSPEDARALGVAAAHRTTIMIAERPLRWSSQLSMQLGARDYGGNQYLADTRARLPVLPGTLGVTARLIGLRVAHDHHRYEDEHALSAILGIDAPVLERGRLSVLFEQRASTNEVASTNIYGVIEMEVWR